VLAPDGPLPFVLPDPTDEQVRPAIEFMLAGLPQIQGFELNGTVDAPLVLDLTGPGAMTVTVRPADQPNGRLKVVPGANGETRISSTAMEFIAWATTRTPWREYCAISGDASAAIPLLDRLNII
jgi:hypothetical protein